MVFSTPCCARPDARLRTLAALCVAVVLFVAGVVQAAEASAVRHAEIRPTASGYTLDADVDLVLNPTLEDALAKGINLYFLLEFEVTRPRNWWFDEDIAEVSRKLRLYYHLLLRRYVVETGYTTQTAATLGEALAMLGHVDDWPVLERGDLKTGRRYEARLRLRLDTARLPKTLSIGAVTSDRWDLVTPWHTWLFQAPPLPAATLPLP